jgi:hypothetical protein
MVKPRLEQELLRLEERFWRAIQERDADTAMWLTDESCILTGAQGVGRVPRSAFKAMMKSAQYTLNDFQLNDPQVLQIGDDVAILAYNVHEELTVDGESVTLDAADASTWVRRDGGWVCALHTESILGDPFGRDRRAAGVN